MRRGLAAAMIAALFLPPTVTEAAIPGFEPATLRDQADGTLESIDLRLVAFGQVETHLVLRIRTQDPWSTRDLDSEELCVDLRRRSRQLGRLCVWAAPGGRPGLRFGRAANGPLRPIHAAVERPGARRLVARLAPHELGLEFGPIRWAVRTEADRAPDAGWSRGRLSAYGAPPCYGAAAFAAGQCVNPALRRLITPSPNGALLMHDGDCHPVTAPARYTQIDPCEVGNVFGDRSARVALVGDSHAAHLRAAIDVAAAARGWRATTMTRPGCSFSTEVYPRSPASCRQHTEEALAWLRSHPSIQTVITSSSAGRGLSSAGYLAIWRRVPSSVRRILVVRDVPRGTFATGGCVEAIKRRRASAVRACPISRGTALPTDSSAAAAASAGGRVRLIDLTRHFCDTRACYPVIGGVYAFRDKDHINRVFAATLGPYLLRGLGK